MDSHTRETPDEKSALSFTDDLPTEIRLEVYKHLFNVPDKFFEFRFSGYLNSHEPPPMNSYQGIAAQREGLCMMRVCSKIRGEVVQYFYGGNNFRFSHSDGMMVMSCFFHTIGGFSCSFIKHITVQLPSPWTPTGWPNCQWDWICGMVSRQGMRVPDHEYQPKYKRDVRSRGKYSHDEAVRGVFRQLRDMPNLKKLEVAMPTKYHFFGYIVGKTYLRCDCPRMEAWATSSDDHTRHMIQVHSRYGEYMDLLADLKENASSRGLTITLVLFYSDFPDSSPPWGMSQKMLDETSRRSRREDSWAAAYAATMGCKIGHAIWEQNDEGYFTYKVRYGEDPMLSNEVNPYASYDVII